MVRPSAVVEAWPGSMPPGLGLFAASRSIPRTSLKRSAQAKFRPDRHADNYVVTRVSECDLASAPAPESLGLARRHCRSGRRPAAAKIGAKHGWAARR